MNPIVTLHTSLRERNPEETLADCRTASDSVGISVVDLTDTDPIGLPVFAGLLPDEQGVPRRISAGKGVSKLEARVGAYMEALELLRMRPENNIIPTERRPPSDFLDGRVRPHALLDFCPLWGSEIDLSELMRGVAALDMRSGKKYWIPAELAYLPGLDTEKCFGCNSNGLASGNSRMEATLHGLLEVLERDIHSFQTIQPNYQEVKPASLPTSIQPLAARIQSVGNDLHLLHGNNEHELPYFLVAILDASGQLHLGFGCHFRKDIALRRALTEAVQVKVVRQFEYNLVRPKPMSKGPTGAEMLAFLLQHAPLATFDELTEPDWPVGSLSNYVDLLLRRLEDNGFSFVFQLVYTPPDAALQVVKMVIPKMEFFRPDTRKIGPRLGALADRMTAS